MMMYWSSRIKHQATEDYTSIKIHGRQHIEMQALEIFFFSVSKFNWSEIPWLKLYWGIVSFQQELYTE